MAWQKKPGGEFLDIRTGMHVIHLHDPVSGAEHVLQVITGHEKCLHCHHLMPKTNLDEIDVKAAIQNEIDALNLSHENQRAYARKHGVPVKGVKR